MRPGRMLHGHLNMTTTLIEALRADARVKLAIIHSQNDLRHAMAVLTEAIDLMRTAPEDRPDRPLEADPARRLAADLITIEAVRADLAARLDAHERALEAGIFGPVAQTTPTS